MGCFLSTQKKNGNQLENKTIINYKTYLREQQITLLKLIFRDLSWRIPDHKLNLENFKLFFQKKGLWGQKLFNQFLVMQTTYIDEQTFLSGMGFIFKSSREERMKILFKFFANCDDYEEGITFQQFIIMLYNYPTEQVKELLNDKDFFNQQLRHHLKIVGKTKKNNETSNTLEEQFILCKVTNEDSQMIPTTTIVRSDSKIRANTFQINFQNEHYQIKLSNIQNLLKKYARCIFQKFNVNIETGRLKYEQFITWVESHEKFYTSYFQGVHNQIWQLDSDSNKPKLQKTKKNCQLQGQCKITKIDSDDIKKVYLRLIHSCLVVWRNKQDQIPYEIICLDGLQVKNNYHEDQGFGLEIYHRDYVYKNKKIYFRNEQIQKDWLKALSSYKGQKIQQLYKLGDQIGKGGFGVVYKCIDQPYAVKDIQKYKYLSKQDKEFIQHQSDIMKQLNSPFIVKYIQTIKTKFQYYIITELVQGKDLIQYVHKFHYLTQKEAIPIAYQLILGVKYLHNNGIVHRDLKPQNIMVNLDSQGNLKGKIKIIDLGLSNYLYILQQMQSKGQPIGAGTAGFIAPELIKNHKINQKIDNFSIGVIIYFMVYGKRPFDGMDQIQIYENTINGTYQFKEKPKNISQNCKDLISRLLILNPQQRLSLDDAIKHPWFDNYRPHHQ